LNVLPSFQQPISGPQRFESYLDGIRGSIGEKGSPLFVEKQFSNNGHYGNDAITADFAPGDWVLASAGFNSINASPPPRILISFQQPVHFVGTQLGRPNVAGSFTASVQAFNKNTLIGTFSRNGFTTASGDNSAIFLGVMDTEAVITDAIYTATDPTGKPVGIMINQVSVIQ